MTFHFEQQLHSARSVLIQDGSINYGNKSIQILRTREMNFLSRKRHLLRSARGLKGRNCWWVRKYDSTQRDSRWLTESHHTFVIPSYCLAFRLSIIDYRRGDNENRRRVTQRFLSIDLIMMQR